MRATGIICHSLMIKVKPKTEFYKSCPKCNVTVYYTLKSNLAQSVKNNKLCQSCCRPDITDNKNPFYNKKHSQEAKDKVSFHNKHIRILSEEFIETARTNLKKVTNHTPIYEIWLTKYGEEEADKRNIAYKEKQRFNNSGSKNSMYGKPSPQGSGNGWSGWYKEWYFRSLRELSYMINVINKNSLDWKPGEGSVRIKYTFFDGTERNYSPDFIIGNKMIEIKPKKLQATPLVQLKAKAASEYCLNNQMEFELIDPQILTDDEIFELYSKKEIKFLDRYEKKFLERYNKP